MSEYMKNTALYYIEYREISFINTAFFIYVYTFIIYTIRLFIGQENLLVYALDWETLRNWK